MEKDITCIFVALQIFIFGSIIIATTPELPPCPTNINFFPQNLPMHCRIARDANSPEPPNKMPIFPPIMQLPPFFQSPPPNKVPNPIPIPVPPSLPGGMPMQIQMPMPIMPPQSQKLPVIVMPFYSPDSSFKKPESQQGLINRKISVNKRRKRRRRPHNYDTDASSDTDDTDTSSTESSDDLSSAENGFWQSNRGFRRNKSHKTRRKNTSKREKKRLLTPILQYVTKDGYVIFEKKISNGEATDWLKLKGEDKQKEKQYDNDNERPSRKVNNVKSKIDNNKVNEQDELEEITQGNTKKRYRTHKNTSN